MRSPLPGARRAERGSALLLAVMLVLVLAIVGLAIANRASSEGESVSAKRHHDASVSCADTARELLMSKFSAYGASPTQVTLSESVNDHTLATGHYDLSGATVTSVVAVTSGSAQSQIGVSDVSNRIAKAGLGGQVYRMTVVCSSSAPGSTADGGFRQSEVEYLVRFGL
ncbi:hypothetical protein FGE12_10445 [Aggregicoccus sp. 17bor-14]|uniref:hypothetical protein n=1 Tax=Myxococcaceae TaxID=31 RepID=UPI00129C43C9|nr:MULTISPECIES: hypothetical protein [Myxococcaceae]MBF5042812.1 hypothetical protein [Simulacricoccus sp. 17bor-14]MRI88580.1 hypothetical protein [Aggregicoccus sp. 17bor-14]